MFDLSQFKHNLADSIAFFVTIQDVIALFSLWYFILLTFKRPFILPKQHTLLDVLLLPNKGVWGQLVTKDVNDITITTRRFSCHRS